MYPKLVLSSASPFFSLLGTRIEGMWYHTRLWVSFLPPFFPSFLLSFLPSSLSLSPSLPPFLSSFSLSFLYFSVLVFEHRVLCLRGRCSTTCHAYSPTAVFFWYLLAMIHTILPPPLHSL
jgi:hypothetical protein